MRERRQQMQITPTSQMHSIDECMRVSSAATVAEYGRCMLMLFGFAFRLCRIRSGLLGYFRVHQQRRPPHKINTTCSSSHMHTIQIQTVCAFRSSCSYKKQPFRWLVSHPQFIYPFLSSTVSQSPLAFVCCMRAFRVYFARHTDE